jgi:hypothetical protein
MRVATWNFFSSGGNLTTIEGLLWQAGRRNLLPSFLFSDKSRFGTPPPSTGFSLSASPHPRFFSFCRRATFA